MTAAFYTGFLTLVPWTFLFGLPWLHVGIWIDVEGVAFFLASLTFLIIAFTGLSWTFDRSQRSTHTLKLDSGGIILFTLLLLFLGVLPFHKDMQLSWFGHPENGIGLWFIAFLICLKFAALELNDAQRKVVLVSVFLALLCLAGVTFFLHPRWLGSSNTSWVIYHFTDYLMWPAIGFLFLAAFGEHRILYLSMAALLIVLSNNRSLMLALILGSSILGFTHFFITKERQRLFLTGCLILTPFISPAGFFFFDGHYSETFANLLSRLKSLKIVGSDFLLNEPYRLLSGFGFGQMSDAIVRNALVIGEKVFQGGTWAPTWEGIGRYDGSSLNQFVDFLHAGGIAACLLYGGYLLSPYFASHTKERLYLLFLSAFCLVSCASLWFIMPATFVIMVVMIGLYAQPRYFFEIGTMTRRALGLVLLSISPVFFWTSQTMYQTAVFYSGDLPSLSARLVENQPITPRTLIAYRGPGSIHFAFWLRHYLKSSGRSVDDTILKVVQHLYKTSHPSLTLAESINDVYLHFEKQGYPPPLDAVYNKVEAELPHRPDLWRMDPF